MSSPAPESTNDSTKVYLPLPPPDDLHKEDPQAQLTSSESGMYDVVFLHFTTPDYKLPGFESQDEAVASESDELEEKEGYAEGQRRKWTSELIEEEKFWLSYECILR
jgi:hypothetical protein